jgi:hypothetical protein
LILGRVQGAPQLHAHACARAQTDQRLTGSGPEDRSAKEKAAEVAAEASNCQCDAV